LLKWEVRVGGQTEGVQAEGCNPRTKLVYSVHLVYLVDFVQPNKQENQTNQIDQIDQIDQDRLSVGLDPFGLNPFSLNT
jgi:hypothetical protein